MASWLAIRKPVTGLRGTLLKILSLLIPLALWCLVSYCPYIWHPLVEITAPGDSGLEVGVTCSPHVLHDIINKDLIADGKIPAQGRPANPPVLPAPHQVAKAFYLAFVTEPYLHGDPWFHQNILLSLKTIFLGFSLAMLLAIPIGILCGSFDTVAKLIEPFTDFVRYMPPPTFSALMIGLWDIYQAPKIGIIFIGCFFNMVLITANTARSLDATLLEAAQTLGARRVNLISHVVIPGILPGLFKDMRITLGAAWTFLTAAELVGQMSGLSEFINQNGKHQNYANVYAAMIIIGLLGFSIDQFLAFIATLIFPWTPEANHKVRRYFRFLSFLTRPVQGSHPEPLTAEEAARYTRPRRSSLPFSTEGVATLQAVQEAPPPQTLSTAAEGT